MMINKIQFPQYNFVKTSFKGNNKETPCDFFDDEYKKFSKMQKNYYSFNYSPKKTLGVVFPVNGDDRSYLSIMRSNTRKLKPQEKILLFSNPDYTINGAICSDKGFTDEIVECIAVLLSNRNKAYLYHLNPLYYQKEQDLEQLHQALQNSISDLKDCSAFLFGGLSGLSDKLYDNISQVLDKNNIERQEVVFSVDDRKSHSIYFDVARGIILSDGVCGYHSKQQLEEIFEKVNVNNYFYSEII